MKDLSLGIIVKYSTRLHSLLVSSRIVLSEKSILNLQAYPCKITIGEVLSEADFFLLFNNLLFFGGPGDGKGAGRRICTRL